MEPNECIKVKILNMGRHGFEPSVDGNLRVVIETEPRSTSHYALTSRNNSRRYYYCGGMSYFRFWIKYLELFGTEDDELFLAQGKDNHFYKTYTRLGRVKRKPVYTGTDPMRSPSVSYDYARQFWDQFNIKFEARKCDVCELCFRLRSNISCTNNSNQQKEQAKIALFDH